MTCSGSCSWLVGEEGHRPRISDSRSSVLLLPCVYIGNRAEDLRPGVSDVQSALLQVAGHTSGDLVNLLGSILHMLTS